MAFDRRAVWMLAAVLALAGALRWTALQATYPIKTIGDENYYAMTALQIARGRGHVNGPSPNASRAWRPPAHAYVLSLLADPDVPLNEFTVPSFLRPMLRLQVVLGTALVAVTALLGAALFDARVGLVAGLLAALYPTLIAHSHYLWSETLFAVLVTTALLGVVWLEKRRSWVVTALTGLAFGVAALTREVALPVAAVSAFWWWGGAGGEREPAGRGRRVAALRGAAVLGIAALVILPWTIRNHRVLGRWIPVSTVGWFAAGEGNTLEQPDWLRPEGPAQSAYGLAYFEIPSEVDRIDFSRRHALERIAAEQPTWILKKALRNLALLWGPDSVLLYKLRRNAYGEVPPWVLPTATVVTFASYTFVLVAAVLGIAAAPGADRRRLPCLVLGVVAALHIATNATARFRVPWLPLLMVYAAYALTHARALPGALRGRRRIAPAAALLFYLAVCIPYFLRYGGRS